MKATAIIPARYGSTRLPGKALLDIGGKSLIQRVYERAREAATMVMLLAAGYLAGRTGWQRLAYWLFAFGVWDIFYYVWLYVYLRWPASPGTRDLLFLIPGEWWAPVWMPMLASLAFVAVAVLILAKTRR